MPQEICEHLFVYGSLRSGFKSPAYQYISQFFSFVAEAKVKGRLFDLGEFPAAVACDEEDFVIGELYRIRNWLDYGWAFGQLDDYEGIDPGDGEIPLYERELVQVFTAGASYKAWIYWYAADVSGKPLIPSGDMIQYLREKNNSSATSPQ